MNPKIQNLCTLVLVTYLAACAHKQPTAETKAPPPTTTTGQVEAKISDLKSKIELKASNFIDRAECTLKTETRSLEVRAKASGCELFYTKAGHEKIVAHSEHGAEYCQTAMKKIRENLIKANYACE